MIAPKELLDMKQRMLIAADAAQLMASTSEEVVRFDEEQYGLVLQAFTSLKTDVRRVLAELDILRGMFSEKLGAFFQEVVTNAGDGQTDVGAVPNGEVVGGGEEVRKDEAAVAGGVPAKRAPRKRTRRPKPSGDTGSDSPSEDAVGRGD